MLYGIAGKILVVDLSTQTYEIESLDEEIYRKFYGGYGLGVHYIYHHIKPGCDPLGPDNILGFIPGLLTGSMAPMTGRYIVCAKSPLTGKGTKTDGSDGTGGWGNANSGGTFGPAIRKAGFDGIFFKGVANNPVYLYINGNEIEIREANELWGLDAVETNHKLKDIHGKKIKTACIGPSGENVNLISGIVNDNGRLAARSGLGAVMGSKKLKALCLNGTFKVEFADRPSMIEHTKAYNAQIKKRKSHKLLNKGINESDLAAPLLRMTGMGVGGNGKFNAMLLTATFGGAALGTTASNVMSSQNGDMPIKNFKGVGYKDYPMKKALKLRGKTLKKYMVKQYGCFACPVQCGAILKYDGLPYPEKETHRPEYETCGAFGGLILNDDIDALFKINEYLNRMGMDSISAGMTISYVVECCEQGLLSQKDFICKDYPEGFLPAWNTSDYILPLLKLMVTREGIGSKLADGTKVASTQIPNSAQYAINVNGQEVPMHDPRLDAALGLTYLTDPTPGRHTAGTIDFEAGMGANSFIKEIDFKNSKDLEKKAFHQAKVVKFHQTEETLGFCIFANYYGKYPYLEMIHAAFGWDITPEEILSTGHRIQTLRQMFNAREGAIRHDMPQRLMGSPPLDKGPVKKVSIDFEAMAQKYYEGMGYDPQGIPTKETLETLELGDCVKDLPQCSGVPKEIVNKYLQESNVAPRKSPNVKPLGGG